MHMDKVFSSGNYSADTTNFSNITANSIAGWIANILYLKGVNTTLGNGPHSGLQALAFAFDNIKLGRTKYMVAGAADEVDKQTFYNYDLVGYLYNGEHEKDYKYRADEAKKKVLGEGAVMFLTETLSEAKERNAPIFGEILGYAITCDSDPFGTQCLDPQQLETAMEKALKRSELSCEDIDMVIWAPQGNIHDNKVLHVYDKHFKGKPIITNTFNTGYIESSSILSALGCALYCLNMGQPLWPQITGIKSVDEMELNNEINNILVLSSTDIGYNYSVVLNRKLV